MSISAMHFEYVFFLSVLSETRPLAHTLCSGRLIPITALYAGICQLAGM
uniref:Uncharacterized protein n=1 Tax=Anguilla anguilla TaxID=7936 RepID=A0A0E9TAJ0_ANGAN